MFALLQSPAALDCYGGTKSAATPSGQFPNMVDYAPLIGKASSAVILLMAGLANASGFPLIRPHSSSVGPICCNTI
jgi:hypothetical protein